MLALALVAVSVGFSNMAASIGLGVGGVTIATRIRVLLAFGLFEAGMPIIGLLIGSHLAGAIGSQAKWVGAALLIGVGCYGIFGFVRSLRAPRKQASATASAAVSAAVSAATSAAVSGAASAASAPARQEPGRRREWMKVGLSAFALSLDNLIVGFALGSYQVNLVTGALVFGFVSIAMSLAGLEFGARLGRWFGGSGEMIGGIVLVGVGLAIGFGMLG